MTSAADTPAASGGGLLYLLDTNVLSELARERPHPGVMQHVGQWQAQCALAATTVEELHFGIARLPEGARRRLLAQWLEGMLASFPVLPYDGKAAFWLGGERARQAAQGRTLARPDGEIAAIAVAHGLTLVTRNVNDFRAIGQLPVVDWFSAG